jgi:putative redox protein
MVTSAKLKWREGLKFSVEVGDGRRIDLDSTEQMGQAFAPMELFLVSLAGCTAMDIQWIMGRQRQKLDRLEISAQGIRRKEDPAYFERIDMEYLLGGQNIKKNAVERAIRLSMEKYCSVRAMIKDIVELNVTYVIQNGKEAAQRFAYVTAPNPK